MEGAGTGLYLCLRFVKNNVDNLTRSGYNVYRAKIWISIFDPKESGDDDVAEDRKRRQKTGRKGLDHGASTGIDRHRKCRGLRDHRHASGPCFRLVDHGMDGVRRPGLRSGADVSPGIYAGRQKR